MKHGAAAEAFFKPPSCDHCERSSSYRKAAASCAFSRVWNHQSQRKRELEKVSSYIRSWTKMPPGKSVTQAFSKPGLLWESVGFFRLLYEAIVEELRPLRWLLFLGEIQGEVVMVWCRRRSLMGEIWEPFMVHAVRRTTSFMSLVHPQLVHTNGFFGCLFFFGMTFMSSVNGMWEMLAKALEENCSITWWCSN